MARQIALDDREYIEIVNSRKEVTGGFWWNPADLDIAKRAEKVIEFFENLKLTRDAKADELFEISDKIKDQFDYLLSPGAAEELFKYSNPLSLRPDGPLYCEYVLSTIAQFIESEMNVRLKKTSARIKKYTEKYAKK